MSNRIYYYKNSECYKGHKFSKYGKTLAEITRKNEDRFYVICQKCAKINQVKQIHEKLRN